jgi:hypothetical protein
LSGGGCEPCVLQSVNAFLMPTKPRRRLKTGLGAGRRVPPSAILRSALASTSLGDAQHPFLWLPCAPRSIFRHVAMALADSDPCSLRPSVRSKRHHHVCDSARFLASQAHDMAGRLLCTEHDSVALIRHGSGVSSSAGFIWSFDRHRFAPVVCACLGFEWRWQPPLVRRRSH